MGFNPIVLRALADTLGTSHLIAGSDWPVVSRGPVRERLFGALQQAGFTPAEQRLIAADNTLALLRRGAH